jgi:transcriptional regulator with XRE-family HTH domain
MELKPINIYVGLQLRKFREARDQTQEEFANYCGLSRAYYGRIERGEHSLTVVKCYAICESLQIRMEELFSDLE